MENNPNHQRLNSDPSVSGKQQSECLELIADWLAIYEGNYGKEPTGATIAAYRFGLSDLKPSLLHKAFSVCLRNCTFWPNVAEIRAAYRAEADNTIPFNALPEHDDSMTTEERKKIFTDIEARFKATKAWEPTQERIAPTPSLYVPPTPEEIHERQELLRRQAADIVKKYNAKGA